MIVAQYSALVALLENLIDYAGLFPPASLPPHRVAQDYLSYLQMSSRFAVGRLIWPAGRLAQMPAFQNPVMLSAILANPQELALILEHNSRKDHPHKFDSLEIRWTPSLHVQDLEEKWGYWAYFEVTAEEAEEAAQRLPRRPCWGLKLRTGGLTADAIPATSSILRFLQTCHSHSRPYKFTAGLHHVLPGVLQGEARMHGFLNLFLASALHWQGHLPAQDFQSLMLEAAPLAFNWQPQGVGWRDYSISLTELRQFRTVGGRSFGSCSFLEPVQELQALGWLGT